MNPADAPARLPTGARDVLPTEAAELRDAEDALRRVLRLNGYREVRTPTLEYGEAIERAAARGVDEAYRLFDADGRVLVLRPGSGVCLEESITADNRHDPARRQDLHDRIAAVMEYDL